MQHQRFGIRTVNVKCCWRLTYHPHLSCKISPNLSPAWSQKLNSTLPKVPHMNSMLGSSASCNCLAPGFHLQMHLEVVDFLETHPAQLLSENTSTITSDDRSLFLKAASTGRLSAATAPCSFSSNQTPCSSAPLRYHNKCLNQLKALAVGFALYDKSNLTASKPNPLGQAIHFRAFHCFCQAPRQRFSCCCCVWYLLRPLCFQIAHFNRLWNVVLVGPFTPMPPRWLARTAPSIPGPPKGNGS